MSSYADRSLSSASTTAAGCERLQGLTRDYDQTELLADGIVHLIGLTLALIGLIALLSTASRLTNPVEYSAIWLYGVGLLIMLGSSAAYNLWPLGSFKWFLRRCDKSGIYVMIAGSITPLIVHAKLDLTIASFPLLLWIVALAGVVVTFVRQNRFAPSSVLEYFAFGCVGVLFYAPAWPRLSTLTLWLLIGGGVIYSIGVAFYLWERLRFQQVVWHGFVLAAAACHYVAILHCVSRSLA
jgi:hemolysin III